MFLPVTCLSAPLQLDAYNAADSQVECFRGVFHAEIGMKISNPVSRATPIKFCIIPL